MENKEIKTVNGWLYRQDLEKGFTFANAKFKHDYSMLRRELRKQAALLYFLNVGCGIRYVSKMMYSAKNQAHFCGSVVLALNEKKVQKEHIKVFQKNVKSIKRRLETISRITREDIHLTEYEPFFEAEIYDKDIDELVFEDIPEMAKKWNAEHKDIVEAHLKAIQPEVERHEKFVEQKKAKIKAEKEAEKKAKKEQREYEDEIIKNRKKNRAEYNKLERSFQRYYEGGA